MKTKLSRSLAALAGLTASRVDQRIPLKGLRRRVAEKMVRSKFTAPHYTFVEEMDASALVAVRQRLNEARATYARRSSERAASV